MANRFKTARVAFRTKPGNEAAGEYLNQLMKHESDGVAEVAYWLKYGKQIA